MNNLNSHYLSDTNSSFYSNVDRLIKIIDITIQKGQNKNAERYLKYLFEVFVKYYFKISQTNPESNIIAQTPNAISEASENDTIFSVFQNSIRERNLHRNNQDYFNEKINHLLLENIKTNKYEIFHFILRLYQDSLLFLLDNPQTNRTATNLIYNFKFIADKILTLDDNVSTYERSWFRNELFEWFIEFYSSSKYEGSYFQAVENEILYINKNIIDKGKLELFKKFMNRLSTSVFPSNYFLDKSIKDLLPKDQAKAREISNTIRDKIYYRSQLETLNEFLDSIKGLEDAIGSELKNLNYDELKKKELIHLIKQKAFEEFKKNNLKFILVKLIIYSLFKRETTYFKAYLQYHQPPDSDAIWASYDYSIKNQSEIVFLLTHEDEILDKQFFSIDHHGFSIYLNTFIAYYLYNFYKESKPATLPIKDNYDTATIIHYRLTQIKIAIDKSLLETLIEDFSITHYQQIMDKYIEWAKEKKEVLEFKETYESEISEESKSEFVHLFCEGYKRGAIVKNIFALNHKIEDFKKIIKEKTFGVNQLVSKRFFSGKFSVDFAEDFAIEVARSEDINLVMEIEKKAKRIELKRNAFNSFIKNNKNKYNIILSKGKSLSSYSFTDINFTEVWTLKDSVYKNVSGFLGILDSHYNVFFIPGFPQEEYIFLDENSMGKIYQYMPEDLPEGVLEFPFRFSFLDFKNHDYVLEEQLKNSQYDRKELLNNIWLRIFESFEFIQSESEKIVVQVSKY